MALYNHQQTYNFFPRIGAPGRIVDLAPYVVDAFINEEATGVLELGMGVVFGTSKKEIKKPISTSAKADFVGIVVNGGTIEHGIVNEPYLRNQKNLGVMRYGRIYAQAVNTNADDKIAENDAIYLITAGNDAGKFTNQTTVTVNSESKTNVVIKGRFLSAVDETSGVAIVELFNEAQ